MTGVESNRNAVPIALEQVCARGVKREHARPIVRALPMPTAHPLAEAWSAAGRDAGARPVLAGTPARAAPRCTGTEHKPSTAVVKKSERNRLTRGAQDRSARFACLQQRMSAAEAAIRTDRDRRSVVVVPYRRIDEWHESPAETQAYEERLLCSLLELRDPNLRLTYVTSSPIAPTIVDYYLSLLPPRMRRAARSRLTLIAVRERTTRPLSEKLLERPCVLERIRRAIPEPRLCHIIPYNTTALERGLALALDIPIYGADPRHAHFGTKSGCRELFGQAEIPHPLGVQHITSIGGAIHAITRLRATKPDITELVMKLNQGASGEGNAIIDLAGLPESGVPDEAQGIGQRVATLAPAASAVTIAAYLAKLAMHGGIVEERITGRELRSPSVQLRVTPAGQVELL